MRIALVTSSFLPRIGGAEFAIHHLAQQWSRQGHEVRVINTVTDVPTQSDALYSVRRFPLLRGTTRFGYHRFPFAQYEAWRLQSALAKFAPKFISAHFGYPTAMWLARLRPLPQFVITCHGPALDETPRGPRQRYGVETQLVAALNQATRVVAISGFARRILERIGVQTAKLVDIPNGADLPRFRKPLSGLDLRSRFGIRPEAVVILSVGRNEWEKDYETGIRAFARVAEAVPGAHYLICGRGTGALQALVAELGVTRRVTLCDGLYGDDLVGAYQQADIFLMPSVRELCPLVVPEAMAAGLPEVVTNVGGSQDMVQSGENGLVVEPGDPVAMAEALMRLATDSDLRARMAGAGRKRAERYGWEAISRSYLDLA